MKKMAFPVHLEKPSYVFGKMIKPIAMSVEARSINVKPIYELTFEYCGNESNDNFFTPKKIIKSADRTIVFWKDGTKTIVKRSDDATDDLYSAFTAALAEKIYGSNSQVKKILRTKVEVVPLSDRLLKKEWDKYEAQMAEQRAKEEAERPQKILDEYIDKDPIGTAMEEHKAELQKRLAEQINEGIRRRRRKPI